MKGHLYKAYIRPVLFYGLENFDLSAREKLSIKRIEELLLALNIKPTYSTDLTSGFLKSTCQIGTVCTPKRTQMLITNSYTKSILEYIETTETTGSFPNEIDSIYSLMTTPSQAKNDEFMDDSSMNHLIFYK
ncbi:hypothetical protein BpHYR1_007908 [Brachionus plicatilis]|uniref:Uncharacterized protein n=1 Tax=Brachionus plicatilis TaxID=10195 RepID=A0A3M7QIH3_BRAPC|nr:hypothetical protein BpHYR1_007908 [Brachionus plicatilis]